jgi:hypothetical protein
MLLFLMQGLQTELEASKMQQQIRMAIRKEDMKKAVQMATLVHILARGGSLGDYENMQVLLGFLRVPDMPVSHWCDTSGWDIAMALAHCVTKKLKDDIAKVSWFYKPSPSVLFASFSVGTQNI